MAVWRRSFVNFTFLWEKTAMTNSSLRTLLVSSLLATSIFGSTAYADVYKIDPDHSTVGFKIRHLAISSVPGRFGKFDGTVEFDPKNVASSKTEALIQVGSVDTDQPKRDDHLRSPDFFDAAKFPEMKFKSREVKSLSPESFKVVGDLTIKNVTKPVELTVEYQGTAKDPYGNERAAFTASTKLNRKDFGLTWSKLLDSGALVVGDEVTVNLEIEGIKQKA